MKMRLNAMIDFRKALCSVLAMFALNVSAGTVCDYCGQGSASITINAFFRAASESTNVSAVSTTQAHPPVVVKAIFQGTSLVPADAYLLLVTPSQQVFSIVVVDAPAGESHYRLKAGYYPVATGVQFSTRPYVIAGVNERFTQADWEQDISHKFVPGDELGLYALQGIVVESGEDPRLGKNWFAMETKIFYVDQ